jgi:GntR family transcriptional regulator
LTTATGRTIYQQVADDLRSQIAAGALQVDAPIPSTAELMKRYDISNTAARNAVGLLRREGLVEGTPGKGVYVIATPDKVETERASVEGLTRQVGELRAEIQRLVEEQPSEVAAKVEALQAEVGKLQADLRHLYDRLGQPYPNGQSSPKPKRRQSGA